MPIASIPTVRSISSLRARETRAQLSERHQREVVAAHPVAEIEVARESGSREGGLVPAAVRTLRGEEGLRAAQDLGARLVLGGEEPEHRPGGLRGRRLAARRERLVVVGGERLAPPAVEVLMHLQEAGGAANVRRVELVA